MFDPRLGTVHTVRKQTEPQIIFIIISPNFFQKSSTTVRLQMIILNFVCEKRYGTGTVGR